MWFTWMMKRFWHEKYGSYVGMFEKSWPKWRQDFETLEQTKSTTWRTNRQEDRHLNKLPESWKTLHLIIPFTGLFGTTCLLLAIHTLCLSLSPTLCLH